MLKSKIRLDASETQVRALGLRRKCWGKPRHKMWAKMERTDGSLDYV
jgi:hypothetical protein